MSKQISSVDVKLVTFESPLHVSEVLIRLDKELNRPKDGKVFSLEGANTREEIEAKVNGISGKNEFILFSALSHDRWLNAFFATDKTPVTRLYTIGNPLIAQTILQHDNLPGLHIPPRILVTEMPNRSGTKVTYLLPSSVMVLGNNASLREAVEVLDVMLEKLLAKVMNA